jgi:cellulose synthase/poly-beta-1,6-N-acetylglucosamine synthase-like glycosyltransferase
MERNFFILIATAGRPTLLARTLESLASCARPSGFRETIVVENGGQNGAEDIVRSFASRLNTRYLYVPDGNKSRALNEALATMGEGLVFFTDDDVRLTPDTLIRYAEAAYTPDTVPSGRFFGGPTEVDYETEPPAWLQRFFPLSARGWEPDAAAQRSPDLEFLGFNWAAFACDIRNAGGFNPLRGPGAASGSTGQETEMQARLRAAGARPIYIPEARVWHHVPADRSSPEWAVARAFRHGVQAALQAPPARLHLFGCPPWLVGRLITGALRSTAACFATSPPFRLTAQTRRSYNRGLVHGFRLKRTGADGAGEPASAPRPASAPQQAESHAPATTGRGAPSAAS